MVATGSPPNWQDIEISISPEEWARLNIRRTRSFELFRDDPTVLAAFVWPSGIQTTVQKHKNLEQTGEAMIVALRYVDGQYTVESPFGDIASNQHSYDPQTFTEPALAEAAFKEEVGKFFSVWLE